MFARLAEASTSLDIGTLFVLATCVTALLGLFLLFAWMQERIAALAWWGVAYLIGGFSGALWDLGSIVSPPLPEGTPDVLLFIAVGMIWSAARLFHGRPVRWGAMFLGAAVWLTACMSPTFPNLTPARIILSSLIVATYTFLIAAELSRERRKSLIRRWPALFVPMLHGAIFLCPVALASLGLRSLDTGWVAVFAIEVVLYVVGAAFIVMVLAKDRAVSRYKMAAETDPLTGLLNRRGFFEAAAKLMAGNTARKVPVSVLAFDLDHFKSINDRFGHKMGDAMLDLFAKVVRKTMRADDVIGRIGGEEFIAIISEKLPGASIAAERVRAAFEKATLAPDSPQIPATVSVGVACGLPNVAIDLLICRADAALYKAKGNGRNRIEPDNDMVTAPAPASPEARTEVRGNATRPAKAPAPIPALSVPILVR
jgi:diguanylate cyclase (GGDEF)-like protein